MRTGFIGLGRMGHGMATRLLGAGHSLVVFDPDPKQTARMAAAGADVATGLDALAATCDVVISMLPSDEILREAALGKDGLVRHLKPGSIHMVSGTHGVPVMGELAAGHAAAGQTLVACHVLGRPDLAATGKLGLVPGGPPAAVDKVRPMFAAIGDRVIEAGPNPLSATAIKIANNFILGCAIEAMGEGMALVRKYDVDPLVFHKVLVGGLFNCNRLPVVRRPDCARRLGTRRRIRGHRPEGCQPRPRCSPTGGRAAAERGDLAGCPRIRHCPWRSQSRLVGDGARSVSRKRPRIECVAATAAPKSVTGSQHAREVPRHRPVL